CIRDRNVTGVQTCALPIYVSSQDYFKEAKKGNAYISDAFYGKISKNKIVTFSAPVLDEQNNFNGVLVGAVKLETINEVMGSYKEIGRASCREWMECEESKG